MTDYGYDLSGIDDFDLSMGLITGPMVVAQTVARRLITRNGDVIDDEDSGHDLRQYINEILSASELQTIGFYVQQEALKDPRVNDATATVTQSLPDGSLSISLSLELDDGPFSLTLLVSAVSVQVLTDGD